MTYGQLAGRMILGLGLLVLQGCIPETPSSKKNDEAAAEKAEAPKEKKEEKRPNLVKRKTTEVVDKNQAMEENPDLKVVENKVSGSDPLTTALTGYISASSRINTMKMKHQIDLMKAADGRNPTYEEFMKMFKENNLELNALPDCQMYAYDDQTGEFMVLEDPAAKKEFQEQAR